MYYIDLSAPTTVFVPCTFVPSAAAPGKTLLLDESGRSMVVEPDGSQTRWMDAGDPNWDSPWTHGTILSGFLVYRSSNEHTTGAPRGFRMVV